MITFELEEEEARQIQLALERDASRNEELGASEQIEGRGGNATEVYKIAATSYRLSWQVKNAITFHERAQKDAAHEKRQTQAALRLANGRTRFSVVATLKRPRCRRCKLPGHNAKTCENLSQGASRGR